MEKGSEIFCAQAEKENGGCEPWLRIGGVSRGQGCVEVGDSRIERASRSSRAKKWGEGCLVQALPGSQAIMPLLRSFTSTTVSLTQGANMLQKSTIIQKQTRVLPSQLSLWTLHNLMGSIVVCSHTEKTITVDNSS